VFCVYLIVRWILIGQARRWESAKHLELLVRLSQADLDDLAMLAFLGGGKQNPDRVAAYQDVETAFGKQKQKNILLSIIFSLSRVLIFCCCLFIFTMVSTKSHSKSVARQRVKKRPGLRLHLNKSMTNEHWEKIKRFFRFCEDDDGTRFCFNWEAWKTHIHSLPNASELDKLCADILYDISKAVDLEWHHLWPLCCGGSVEHDSNYRLLTILDHIKAHAALAHSFPFVNELHYSLCRTMNTTQLTAEIINDCLDGVVHYYNLMATVILIDCSSFLLLLLHSLAGPGCSSSRVKEANVPDGPDGKQGWW
jgi:hypothetical protein